MVKGKNIVMIGAYPPTHSGGVAMHVYNICRGLSKYNDISVITTGSKSKYWKDGRVKIYQENILYKKRYTTLQANLQATKRVLLLKEVDILHIHGIFLPFICLLPNDLPVICTVHGYSSLETVASGRIKPNSIQFKFKRWVEKRAVKRVDAVIAVAKSLRVRIIGELGANPEKVFYIPNGVDIDKIDAIRNNSIKESEILKKQMGLENKRIILFVKAFTEQNGILTLVKALPLIIKEHKDAHLVAIGGGPLRHQIIFLSKKLKVSANVTFIDRIPNEQVPIYFNFSEIFCVPSFLPFTLERGMRGVGDTLGIAHLEAMVAELPVVASAPIGNKFKAENNNTLIYVPPRDPNVIAEAIIYLLDNHDRAKKMGQNARRYVAKKYTWEKVVNQVSDVYEFALEKYRK